MIFLIGINLPYKLRNLNRLNLFAKNYNKLDFMKNSNLNSKFNYI